MTDTKHTHTPGPWEWYWKQAENDETDCGVFHEKHEGQAYAICRAPRYATRQQWEANARLIAAACTSYDKHCGPRAVECAEADLLGEALEVLHRVAVFFGGTDSPIGAAANAAIAKATGTRLA